MTTRQHVEHLLASLALLGVSLFISYYQGPAREPILPSASELNSLEPVKNPGLAIAPQFNPSLIVSTSTFSAVLPSSRATTTVPKRVTLPRVTIVPPSLVPKKVSVEAPKSEPATTAPPVSVQPVAPRQEAPVPSTPQEQPSVLGDLRKSVVNILCTSHKSPLRGSTGTGVIVDSGGIILTVAHVAQSQLLSDVLGPGVVSCIIRTGNPARNAYYAKVIYISEPWLRKNSTTLISSQPTGTGENDFALLAITGSATGGSLPSSFPAVSLSRGDVSVGQEVGAGGYAAQSLTSTQIRTALSPTFVMGAIAGIYTFNKTTQDVLSVLAGAAAQQGSSGGAVTNPDRMLVGLITTSEISGPTETRHLRAITPRHLRQSFLEDTGKDFDSYYTSASVSTLVSGYAPKVQELGLFIADAIGLK